MASSGIRIYQAFCMCYKTTTLKYTVDDIPLLSNIQPFLQIYDDTEKAVHAFL